MANFIEFPVFDGVSRDLRQWIAWLEDFFVRERFTGDEKMNLAQSLLEGEANAWFYSSRKHFSFQSWEHLVVELLLWRFGYFGDGGVFSDLELFLLWDKYDRILRKRRKRLSRTAINPQESISSPATIHETVPIDKFSTQKVDEISGEKIDESHEATLVKVLDNLEEASVTQNQVPVSQLEPSLPISKEFPTVCENSQAIVGCEHQKSIQKNIRMDVVNGDVERIHRVMSITKNASAHQVLDKMCQLKRLKPKNKRKLHLPLKTWKFKFKNKNLQHNWSQRDLLQVIDRSKINNLYLCFGVKFGLVRKHRTFQCLRLKTQAHKSRVQYHLRRLHDPGGKKDEHFDEIFETEVDIGKVQRTQMDIMAESVITAPDNVALSTAYALDVVNKTSKAWGNQQTFTSKPVASVHSLSFEVGTEETMSSGLSQNRQVWEPGGVLSDHVLVDIVEAGSKGLAYDGCVILGMNCAGFGSSKTELLATGQQMQRTDLFSELLKDSSNGGAESFPILNVVTEHSFLWLQKTSENYLLVSEFEKKKQMLGYKTRMFKYKGIEDAVEIAQVTLLLQLILDDVKSHMRHKWKSTHLRAVYLRTTPSYALDVVNKPVTECKNVRVIATDLARQAVLDQITKGLEMKTKMKVLKSWMFKYKPATSSSMLPLYVYQLGVSDKEMVADPVTQSLLGTLLWSTSFKQQKFCKDWWFKFKYDIAGETQTDTHAYMSVHASTISRLQA